MMTSYSDDKNEWRSGGDLILADWVVINLTNSVLKRVMLDPSATSFCLVPFYRMSRLGRGGSQI